MVDLQVTDVRTFLPAKDFALSKDFYMALGWQLQYADDNLARMEAGKYSFYLQKYYLKEWAENCMLHVSVLDAEACFTQITELLASGRFPGARVAPPKQEPYGALVTYVWDPCGVLLHLAQWTEP